MVSLSRKNVLLRNKKKLPYFFEKGKFSFSRQGLPRQAQLIDTKKNFVGLFQKGLFQEEKVPFTEEYS